MRYLFLLFMLSVSLSAQQLKYTLCACAIFQDEAPYLKEWIDHHLERGVEHIWMYNNNSKDDYKKVLNPYILNGRVELIEWPSIQLENDWANFSFTTQTGAYNDALKRAKKKTKWLAIIDTDEFLFAVQINNIATVLERAYGNCSGVCVNWQCYGTSGVEDAAGRLKNKLIWKLPWNDNHNKFSKSVVQVKHVTTCPNPHHCLFKPDHWAVDTNYNKVDACCSEVNIDILRINHYWTRDEKFLRNVKVPRHQRWGGDAEQILQRAAEMNVEYDPILNHQMKTHS